MKTIDSSTMGNTAVGSKLAGFHECKYVSSDNKDDLFNRMYIDIIKALRFVGYIDSKSDYPHLMKIKNNSMTIDEVIFNLNNHLRENNTSKKCNKLVELIESEGSLWANYNYDLKGVHDHFYLNDLEITACSGNPFYEEKNEVLNLVRLYDELVLNKYKGKKNVKLINDPGTMKDFCCEINRAYCSMKSSNSRALENAFNQFSKDSRVESFINIRKNNKIFYQLVKKETDSVEEPQDSSLTDNNIQYLSSSLPTPVLLPTAVTSMQVTSPNPFDEDDPPELVQLKATYSALVEAPYKKQYSKTTKKLKLENEKIGSIDEFCRALNEIKNSTNGTLASTRYQLLVKFVENEMVAKIIGRMEGIPNDFYIKPTEALCRNGELLESVLNKYVNAETPTLRTGHIEKITEDLKNKTLRDNILIELEPNDHVRVITFPNDKDKIALVLSKLLEGHKVYGTFNEKIAEYLKISGLGAYMQLQPLPNKTLHVELNHDSPDSVNGKIDNLTELMNFMRKHLKDINTELADLPPRPAEWASLEQLQEYFYQQILAFETHSSTYNGVKSAKEWVQDCWIKLFSQVNSETFFGAKKDEPIDTIKNLRQAFHSKVRHDNYEKSVLNSPEYKVIDQGLGRMQKQAQTLHDLIARNTISTDITENLTSALRYSMASECVELKQQSKSINFNHFISKAKVVIPIATVASLIFLAVFPPAAPIAAAVLFSAALIYLFTKFKPKLETSAASKQLSSAMTGLVYQLPFQLVSHDVSWGEAWKDRKGPIMQAIKSWWSGSEAPAPNLSESLNPSPE
ncbi:MFS transporter permease [Yersinia enterocolitica]